MMSDVVKHFNILAISLNVLLYNYFESSIKLFSDLYLAKFLETFAKPFFFYVRYELCVFSNGRQPYYRVPSMNLHREKVH